MAMFRGNIAGSHHVKPRDKNLLPTLVVLEALGRTSLLVERGTEAANMSQRKVLSKANALKPTPVISFRSNYRYISASGNRHAAEPHRKKFIVDAGSIAMALTVGMWLWLSKPMRSHFGAGAPPSLVYFGGDWDVHWGYGLLTRGQ